MALAAREFGDFQTPPELVREVLDTIRATVLRCTRALEPTCGLGNFIDGLQAFPHLTEVVGVEISTTYLEHLRDRFADAPKVRIVAGNIFDQTRINGLCEKGPLLIVGNPPWVTNSTIGVDGGSNLPRKANIKNLRGIDAITGGSNFDIAEWIILRLLDGIGQGVKAHVALLCKSSVARNVVEYAAREDWPLSCAAVRMIDAKGWFDASVDACLFTCSLNAGSVCYELAHYSSLTAAEPDRVMGTAGGKVVADVLTYDALKFLDGKCHIEWRQGVKHDAAPVMELLEDAGRLVNEAREVVDVEAMFVFPLYKGSDLGGRAKLRGRRRVIVTQRRVGEDTLRLEQDAPRLWAYLSGHFDRFTARKSSIYRGKPPFSMFGIGPYSFTACKVAVSGLHKEPRFEAFCASNGEQPAMFDDTCYMLPCDTALQAAACAYTLNHDLVKRFLRSITFKDAKRPITKKVLERVDLIAAAKQIDADAAHRGVIAILQGMGIDTPMPSSFSLAQAVAGGTLPTTGARRLESKRQTPLFASSAPGQVLLSVAAAG